MGLLTHAMLGLKLVHVSKMPPSKHELLINTKVWFSFQVPNYNAWLYFVLLDNTTGRIYILNYTLIWALTYSVQNIHI